MSTTRCAPLSQVEFCSIIVDRQHEALFTEEIASNANKRYLKVAVEKWHEEQQYDYLMVLEDQTDVTAITFVGARLFAEKVAETFAELAGANCIWVLLIEQASRNIFQQILDADNETEAGHALN